MTPLSHSCSPQNTAHQSPSVAMRLLRVVLGLALFVVGWLFIAAQHHLLWQRLNDDAIERYVADGVTQPLPKPMAVGELRRLCAGPQPALAAILPALERRALADCLSSAQQMLKGAPAVAAGQFYATAIDEQLHAAEQWLTDYHAIAPARRAVLLGQLQGLQRERPGLLSWSLNALNLPVADTGKRQTTGPQPGPDAVAELLRSRVVQTQVRRQALLKAIESASSTDSDAATLAARTLGLLASGLQLQLDFGEAPPQASFNTDRQSLADTLEWRRRGQTYEPRGFSLAQLYSTADMLALSALVLVLVAAACGAAVWPWALVTHLLGIGGLVLTDLALTGDPALRFLAVRQYHTLGIGEHWLPLAVESQLMSGAPLRWWWPLLALSASLLVLRLLRDGQGWLLWPLRAWIRAAARPLAGAAQSALLLALGTAAVFGLGLPAAVSEWLILLGCVGLATYFARQAAAANAGTGLDASNLVVAVGALTVALGGALYRGDLGHALVALALGGCFFLLFGGHRIRLVLILVLLASLGALLWMRFANVLPEALSALVETLPPHARERVLAMIDPYTVDSSDLARIRWLIQAAGTDGWGLGRVPWQGLANARAIDGLPLQGPSDYVLSLTVALWGKTPGMLVMAAVLLLFVSSAVVAARTALRCGMPFAIRWLASLGLFGCVVMAGKVVLSVAGVAGILPLTGLPVALVGYGPVGHLMALFYLALALGTAHLQPALEGSGVQLHPRSPPIGTVQVRALTTLVAVVLGLTALLALGAQIMGGAGEVRAHLSKRRHQLAVAVTQALRTSPLPESAAHCPQLTLVVQAWNQRLAALPPAPGSQAPRQLGITELLTLEITADAASQPRACRLLAHELGMLLQKDWPRLAIEVAPPIGAEAKRVAALTVPHPRTSSPADFSTPNPWWGIPGCARPVSALVNLNGQQAAAEAVCEIEVGKAGRSEAGRLDNDVRSLFTDLWLQRELAPRVQSATFTPTGQRSLYGKTVAIGPVLAVTLDTTLQTVTQLIADCFTGRVTGEQCADALPNDASWRKRYFEGGGKRAGALGLVLIEVDSGRLVALAGSLGDCVIEAMSQTVTPDSQGRMPALRQGSTSFCSQWPDRRSQFLALQSPALWMVPPGSSLKPLAVLAGVESRLIGPADDAHWKRILAESHEQDPLQRVALDAGEHYLRTLRALGFGDAQGSAVSELLWGYRPLKGGPLKPPLNVAWRFGLRTGNADLRVAQVMSFDTMQRIRHEKESGANVDKRYGKTVITEYLAARRVADSAIGGNDMRISALGLADIWRRLDLRAHEHNRAPALHLLELPGQPVATIELDFGSPDAARRAIAATTGITSSAWKGTAQGSCRVVFGQCPEQGLADLAGKTGTSDFLEDEKSSTVKAGLQVPAKLFGGVFSHRGKRYAIAAMALRVRDGQTQSLELTSSAPAEAALTLIREMQRRP
ncbi:FtsW/RodA/SpoVE family cell cycle protein [Propionivibrio sp.]|uniref:FtsW/RodA/SpoVE family cell cycle protein n=1 Tax=Propionivibrio sp. TaxID=2212460 RepID=UPI003BF0DE75